MKLSAFRNPKSIAALALIALAFLITLALLADAPSASAQAPDTPTPTPQTNPNFPADFLADSHMPKSKKPPLGNLDSMLSQLVERVEQGISTANAAAASAPISRGESVAVTFYTQADATALADFLRANGGDPRNVIDGYVEAYVPISLLVRASEQPGVVRVDAIVPPQPADDAPLSLDSRGALSKGNVTSQGVALHSATAWHNAGYTGAGVKVGIIDTGFTGFSALMGSELPANVTARCYTSIGRFTSNLADCESGDDNHGTIVAESLLDIAPDVTLYISNPTSRLDHLQATVDWMVSQDVDVINQSVGFVWDGPGDGTSPAHLFNNSPLRTVDSAVNGGITWVNAAGNDKNATWFGSWSDPDNNGALNFRSDADLNGFYLDEGEEFIAQLRWSDSWGGADTDLDLQLYYNGSPTRIWGENFQSGGPQHIPYEEFAFPAPVSGRYGLAVWHYAGEFPDWIQLQAFTGQDLNFSSEGGSITNPAESANPGLLAVGATHHWDTNTIASYSSRGPAPDGRTKPDITGVACARVADEQAVNLSNGQQCWFAGTSQSSPHVAGLAALVKDAFPSYTPRQIANYLKTNAQRRGVKPNNIWGYGFARLPAPPQTTAPPTATPAPTPGGDIVGRLSALEQLAQSLRSLIQAMTNRVAALEQGGGVAPVATPTATATPSPTPTRVAGPRPSPTPVGDACTQPLSLNTSWNPGVAHDRVHGIWTPDCVNANPPIRDGGTRYARFYTFTLRAEAEVSITLTSSEPNYLYLRLGAGHGVIAQRAGATPSRTNTIATTLQPNSYTIETTTYYPNVTGSFSLDMTVDLGCEVSGWCPPTPVSSSACVQPIEQGSTRHGAWTTDCVSVSRPTSWSPYYYAKFYTFTLPQSATATITLTSEEEPDTYLYLLEGAGKDGAVLHRNDDIDVAAGNYGSRISERLPAGSYTIESTTNEPNVTGNFTLDLR